MNNLLQDLKYAVRTLLKSPGFTLLAVLTLALGIGANSAIFTVVNAVILRPLPFAQPRQLVNVTMSDAKEKNQPVPFSALDFADFRSQAASYSNLAAISPQWLLALTGIGEPETIRGYYISANFLSMLGVQPAVGRGFIDSDDTRGSVPTVLLSHALWQQRFGGEAGVLGKSVMLGGSPYTVIGVMPASFRWTDDAQVWLPLANNPFTQRPRGVRLFQVVGRLRDGVTLEQAGSEAATIAARLAQQYPDSNKTLGAAIGPLAERFRGEITTLLLVLLGAVAFVLLIACANVANLLLARAAGRAREMAIRAALGAGRARLVRQLLTESVLMSVFAAAAGLLLASWGVDLLLNLSPTPLPRQPEIAVDVAVLMFTMLLAILTGLLFGLAPAWQVSRTALVDALKEGGRGASAAGHGRLRSALVVAEVALSMVVVIGAGLLIKSLVRLSGVDPGFNTSSVVSMGLALAPTKYPDHNARVAFMQRLYERIEGLPGVEAAGDITRVPLGGANNPTTSLEIEGTPLPPGERPEIDFRRASRNYFRAMSIPLAEGREFAQTDDADAPAVAIINGAAARKFYPGQSAVGKRIRTGPGPTQAWTTIVGVVGDIRHVGLNVEPRPEMYIHTLQATPNFPGVMVRTAADPATLAGALRHVVRELDSEMPVQLETMSDVRYRSMAQPRFNAALLGIFAALALVLALVGVYGVLAYTVTQRTQEIGVRMALGAQPGDVVRMVVREGLARTAAGIALGALVAAGVTRWLREMLFGVTPTDPATFIGIAALLAATALAASWLPARRAARVDPMVALRYE